MRKINFMILPVLLATTVFALTACSSNDDDNVVKNKDGKFNTEYVDLGLSVKWAKCNLGATTPEGTGFYYAWGETSPKETYTPVNYKWYTKDTTLVKTYLPEGKDLWYAVGDWYEGEAYYEIKYMRSFEHMLLEDADDAATVNLGKPWQMPTRLQCEELIRFCKWTYTKQNGVTGFLVTGPSGNSIFIPATEDYPYTYDGIPRIGKSDKFWAKENFGHGDGGSEPAYLLVAYIADDEDANRVASDDRYKGLHIRPVHP